MTLGKRDNLPCNAPSDGSGSTHLCPLEGSFADADADEAWEPCDLLVRKSRHGRAFSFCSAHS